MAMGNISKLPKDRMIRPSVIGAVDKINEIIDDVNETDDDLATLTDKVEGLIVEGGEPNVIESVSLNGEPLPVVNKNVDVSTITTKSTTGPAYGPLASVTANGHAEQDGTPTPSDPKEIRVVRGRNLLRNNRATTTIAGITFTVNDDGTIVVSGTATNNANLDIGRDLTTLPAGTYMAGSLEGSGCEITIFKIVDGVATAILSGITRPTPFTLVEDTSVFLRVFVKSGATANATAYPQFEAGSTAHPYVPYGHVGLEVATPMQVEKVDYYIPDSGIDTAAPNYNIHSTRVSGGSYALRFMKNGNSTVRVHAYDGNGAWIAQAANLAVTAAMADGERTEFVTLPDGTATVRLSAVSSFTDFELVSVTPIPLPSRGWVGSLPDGTHDALSIDGAGRVTWELADAVVKVPELTFAYDSSGKRFYASAATLGIRGLQTVRLTPMLSESFVSIWHGEEYDASWDGVTYLSGTNLFAFAKAYDNVADFTSAFANTSLYYPLATPTTVEVGHVNLPDIPEGAVVSIPELEGLGVESWTSDAVARYVRAWVERLSTPSTLLPAGE